MKTVLLVLLAFVFSSIVMAQDEEQTIDPTDPMTYVTVMEGQSFRYPFDEGFRIAGPFETTARKNVLLGAVKGSALQQGEMLCLIPMIQEEGEEEILITCTQIVVTPEGEVEVDDYTFEVSKDISDRFQLEDGNTTLLQINE